MNFLFRSIRFPQAERRNVARQKAALDVRKRAEELTDAELIEAADAYFASFTPDSIQYKKPFSDPHQATQLTQHLGLLLEAAELFRGATVLDFGCSTGWLSLGLAQMGCDAVGIDIAKTAVRLAERLKSTRHVESDGRMDFRIYDGHRIPAPDASFDRVVCCDAFHHVRDQGLVLREFARVLKPGGRAAFIEPGPHHSLTEQSQAEMQTFKILENDVCMKTIRELATAAGLSPPRMIVQFAKPFHIDVDEFVDWSDRGIPLQKSHQLLTSLQRQLTDAQCFYMTKGQPSFDSRVPAALAGELRLETMQTHANAGEVRHEFRMLLRNTGEGTWLAQKDAPGQVRLGVQVLRTSGELVSRDYARFDIPQPVEPGQEIRLEGELQAPNLSDYVLKFDLVAEQVAWFTETGRTHPLVLRPSDLRPPN
jgi:2-polyprenyl-3-methyl-5-hydroxy-6-metoxy-1,4-benzoquinol methylase